MNKKSSIIKLSIIGVVIILGLIFAFIPMNFGYRFKSFTRTIKLGLDVKGGVYAIYEAEDNGKASFDNDLQRTMDSLSDMLREKHPEVIVQRLGDNKIKVSLPHSEDSSSRLSIFGNPAYLEFLIDEGETSLKPEHIAKASVSSYTGETSTGWAVNIDFTAAGRKEFARLTAQNIGSTLTINSVVGEDSTKINSSTIEAAIDSKQITATVYTAKENAQNLADQINAGLLPLKLTQEGSIGEAEPTLGTNAHIFCLAAIITSVIAVMALLIYFYGLFGVVSGIITLLYSAVLMFILSIFPWAVVSLGGFAGIILSYILLFDAQIIICRKIKDKAEGGKTLKSAAHHGSRSALRAIIDTNVVALLVGLVLIICGLGAVKSFAITMMIGCFLGAICSTVLTKWIANSFINLFEEKPNLFRLPEAAEEGGQD